jgi:DNA-binding NarL/FixJ family response regulator
MFRVLLADPHPLFRRGLHHELTQVLSDAEIHEVPKANGNVALRLLGDEAWDLFITEIILSGRDGLQVIKRLRRRGQSIPAMILSRLPEQIYAISALRAGATGFLHKTASAEELQTAVRHLIDGRRYFSQAVSERLADQFQNGGSLMPHDQLTDRERQVFLLLAEGERVNEIARELCIAPKTVYTHRRRIKEKLRLGSDSDLARYAFGHGLIQSRRLSDRI